MNNLIKNNWFKISVVSILIGILITLIAIGQTIFDMRKDFNSFSSNCYAKQQAKNGYFPVEDKVVLCPLPELPKLPRIDN